MHNRFRDKFRYYLRRRGIKQYELALLLGYEASTVSKWVNKPVTWSVDILTSACELLELAEDEKRELFELAGFVTPANILDLPEFQTANSTDTFETSPETLIRYHPLFGSPPLPKGFVGRGPEKSDLLKVLEDSDKTIISISGISGIGKTYLAAWLYQTVREQYDGQPLWIDCRTRSVTIEVLLDALTDVSGDSELMKSVQDPSGLLTKRVEQVLQQFMEMKKVVLFLDDYHLLEGLDEQHRLDELIIRVAAHCRQTKLFLIGQRRPKILDHPSVRGAFLEHLVRRLGTEDTKEFVHIPSLTNEQAEEIWMKCAGGVPIAMFLFNIAARRQSLDELLTLPIWGIANTRTQWLEPVLKNLTASEWTCLQAASMFPADIPFKALQYVYNGADFQSSMGGLQDTELLDHEPGSDKWSIRHEVIREYVSEGKIDPAARNKLRGRLAEYYARFVLENIQHPGQLQSESKNILGAMEWYRKQSKETMSTFFQQLLPEVEERAALQMTYCIGELAHRSGDANWAKELYSEVIDLSRTKAYLADLSKALKQLAILVLSTGDKQLAITSLEEAIKAGEAAAAWDIVAAPCYLLGGLLIDQGRIHHVLAEQYLLKGLQTARQSQDELTIARIVGKLIYLYRNQEKFEKAYALYREERHSLSGISLATLILGVVPRLIEKGRFDEAWDGIQEARRIFEQEKNLGGIAFTWRQQGDWCWKQDDLKPAEESYREEERLRILTVEEKEDEIPNLSDALSEQHKFYIITKQIDKAEQCRIRYTHLVTKHDWVLPHMLAQEANLLKDQKNYKAAAQRCHKAMAVIQEQGYQKQGNLGLGAWIKRIQGNIQAAQGKLKAAEQFYKEGLELRNRDGEPRYLAEDLELLAEFYLEKMHDTEQAHKYLTLAQQKYEIIDAKRASIIRAKLRTLQT